MHRRTFLLSLSLLSLPAVRASAAPAWLRELQTLTTGLTTSQRSPSVAVDNLRGVLPSPRTAHSARPRVLPFNLDPEDVLIGAIEERARDARLDVQPTLELPKGYVQRIVGRARLIGDGLPFGAAALNLAYEKDSGRVAAVYLELPSEESVQRAGEHLRLLARVADHLAPVPLPQAHAYAVSDRALLMLLERGTRSALAYCDLLRLRTVSRGT